MSVVPTAAELDTLHDIRSGIARSLSREDPRLADYSRRPPPAEVSHRIATALNLPDNARAAAFAQMREQEYALVMERATKAQHLFPIFARSSDPRRREIAKALLNFVFTPEGSAWVDRLRRPSGTREAGRGVRPGRPEGTHYAKKIDDLLITATIVEWRKKRFRDGITATVLARLIAPLAYGSGAPQSLEARLVKKLSRAMNDG